MLTSLIAQHRELVGTIAPVLGGIAFLLLMYPPIKARMAPFFSYIVGGSWLVTRILFYACIYKFCMVPKVFDDLSKPCDTTMDGGWVYQSSRILLGQIPYRDFFSNYSVLYSYIISLAYRIWHSPYVFVPLFILFDLGCVFLIYAVAKQRWGTELAKDATMAFTLLPITWYVTIRHSQDEVMLAFFSLLATLFWMKKRHVLSMVLFAIGFCCTKFMFGLIVLPFLLASKHKIRDVAVFAGVVLAINLPFMLAGANIFSPLTNLEGGSLGLGFWPALVMVFKLDGANRILFWAAMLSFLIPLLLSIGIIIKRKIQPADAVCVLMMISIALSPKTIVFYALAYMPLFIVFAVSRKESLNLALFTVLALAVPKFFMTWRVEGEIIPFKIGFAVYALYITIVQLYWVMLILRSRSDETISMDDSVVTAVPSPVA